MLYFCPKKSPKSHKLSVATSFSRSNDLVTILGTANSVSMSVLTILACGDLPSVLSNTPLQHIELHTSQYRQPTHYGLLHTAHYTLHTAHCTVHTAHCTPNNTGEETLGMKGLHVIITDVITGYEISTRQGTACTVLPYTALRIGPW